MTTDEIRTFSRHHVENICTHDAALAAGDHAEDGILESPSTGTHRGRAEITQNYERWNTAFPDFDVMVDDIVAEDDQAAVFFLRLAGNTSGRFPRAPSDRQADRVSGGVSAAVAGVPDRTRPAPLRFQRPVDQARHPQGEAGITPSTARGEHGRVGRNHEEDRAVFVRREQGEHGRAESRRHRRDSTNLPHEALMVGDVEEIDTWAPPRQDWLDGTEDYLRKG